MSSEWGAVLMPTTRRVHSLFLLPLYIIFNMENSALQQFEQRLFEMHLRLIDRIEHLATSIERMDNRLNRLESNLIAPVADTDTLKPPAGHMNVEEERAFLKRLIEANSNRLKKRFPNDVVVVSSIVISKALVAIKSAAGLVRSKAISSSSSSNAFMYQGVGMYSQWGELTPDTQNQLVRDLLATIGDGSTFSLYVSPLYARKVMAREFHLTGRQFYKKKVLENADSSNLLQEALDDTTSGSETTAGESRQFYEKKALENAGGASNLLDDDDTTSGSDTTAGDSDTTRDSAETNANDVSSMPADPESSSMGVWTKDADGDSIFELYSLAQQHSPPSDRDDDNAERDVMETAIGSPMNGCDDNNEHHKVIETCAKTTSKRSIGSLLGQEVTTTQDWFDNWYATTICESQNLTLDKKKKTC
ncbi:hypothetical protein BC940DRAFT_314286 [Gongronella butleri]|nr:hypothetical protein BC940DRAFT_314286 [Gongronella butleri]